MKTLTDYSVHIETFPNYIIFIHQARSLYNAVACSPPPLQVVFREPLDDYDALIHLDKKHVPRSAQAVDATPTSCHTHGTKHAHNTMPVVNFDPVQLYLQELEVHTHTHTLIHTLLLITSLIITQEAFSEFAFFFYDQYGGSFIAVVWKPDAFAPQPFKV